MKTEDHVNKIGDRLAGLGHNNPPEPTREERFADIIADVESMAARGTALPAMIEDDDKLGELAEVVRNAKKVRDRIDDLRKDTNRPLQNEVAENNTFFGAHFNRMVRMIDVLNNRAGAYNDAKREAEQTRLREEARAREEAERAERERQEREREESGEKTGIDAEIEAERLERLENDRRAAEARAVKGAGPTRVAGGTVGSTKRTSFRVIGGNYSSLDLNEFRDSFTVDMIDKALRDHVKRHKKTKPVKGVEFFDETTTNIR